jgi:aryl-alcohol dehydrogenase-like predicted oxidoreductase
MQYRKLGRTGLDVSVIGLGTMTWGQQNTESEGHAQMDYAAANGVTLFDTAELYSIPPNPKTAGATERIIGSWFKARKSRDKVILATKAVGRSTMTWFRKDKSPGRITRAQLTEAIDGSLQRLGTDYIDLYQLHWPDRALPWGANPSRYSQAEFDGDGAPFADTLEVLADFIKAGKARYIGISNESAWGTMSFLAASNADGLPRVQSIQNAYNLLNRTFDVALAEVAMREQVSLLAYSPLAQGYLTGKYLEGAMPAGSRRALFNRGQRYELDATDDAIRQYLQVARDFSLDPAQMALAFVNQQPFVASNLIGATSMAQLATNISSIDVTLSPEIIARLDTVHQRFGNCAP